MGWGLFIISYYLFLSVCRDQGLVLCVGVVKTPRRSIRIRCNARIRDDNPTGHGGHGGGSCPIRLPWYPGTPYGVWLMQLQFITRSYCTEKLSSLGSLRLRA